MRASRGIAALTTICSILLLLKFHITITAYSSLLPPLPVFESHEGLSEYLLLARHGLGKRMSTIGPSLKTSRTIVGIAFGVTEGGNGTDVYVEIPLRKRVAVGTSSCFLMPDARPALFVTGS